MKASVRLWALCAAVALAAAGAGCGGGAPEAAGETPSSAGGNPVTAPVDYLGAVAKAKASADKTLDVAGISRAIQTFHAGEGRFPASLAELVSEGYLPRLPEPPAGQRFVYEARTGAFRVEAAR